MIIRAVQESDFNQLREIHSLFYKDEFSFPDFVTNYLCSFVVIDAESGKIICASGIRTILESIALTDKRFNTRIRREALIKILDVSSYISAKNGFDQIHCFVQDCNWEKQLIKHGFNYTKGHSLVLNLG